MRHNVITENIILKSGEKIPFALFDNGLCRCVCREILNGEAYPLLPEDVLPAASVKTIYDVGANIGASCVYWADSYPNATIVAYEPCQDAFSLLKANTSHFRVCIHNAAIGVSRGYAKLFHSDEGDVCNSMIVDDEHSSGSYETVLVLEATQVKLPCDILKVDTEGCELQILATISDCLKDIQVIYVEYHSEDDRICIDAILRDTHTLWFSKSTRPHRGELCYVRNTRIPASYDNWAMR